MFHYLFTNDLRISNLEVFLTEAGKCFVNDTVPSASEDKNANNNMNTLGFYFNLTKDSNCAKACMSGNIRKVVLNFIKKFQFPNPRTTESLNQAVNDGITLAPMRIILQTLYIMGMVEPQNAYLSKAEIAEYIFFNEDIAKSTQPDVMGLAKKILEIREQDNVIEFPEDELLEQRGCYWKQCKRQVREMVKVLCWSGCVKEKEDGTIAIFHEDITRENEADIFEILTYKERWIPDENKTANENKKSYQEYMDIDECDDKSEMKAEEAHMPIVFNTKIDEKLKKQYERNRILFGAPGTGKSFELKKDSKEIMEGTTGYYERVTFHPDYSYSQFVGTYKPVMGDNDNIRYDFVPGPFMRVYAEALKNARTDNPQPYLLLIEEINRAKVAAVFGDVFQLLDRDDDGISEYEIQASEDIQKYLAKSEVLGGSPADYKRIRIPNNMFIWATMNSADQGVFPMDTAFKRRWNFEYLGINKNEEKISGTGKIKIAGREEPIEWNRLRKAINNKMSSDKFKVNEDKLMGPFFLSKKLIASDETGMIIDTTKFIEAFKSKVIMYLYEDAVKQGKRKFFDGCDSSKYSSVCDAFDEKGMGIFGEDFENDYYDK